MKSSVLLLAAALCLPVVAPAAADASNRAPAKRHSAASLTQPFFASDSVWNTPTSAATPLDPQSARLVSSLVAQTKLSLGFATKKWSTPVYRVPADQPRVRVTLDNKTVPLLQTAFDSVPVPPNAVPALGTDAHMVIYQESTDTMWEMYRARKVGDAWYARYGGRILNVSKDPGYYRNVPDGRGSFEQRAWWGATATSLPLAGGLITLDDLARGSIDHAVSMAVPRVLKGLKYWPAQRSDGNKLDAIAIPEGTRFRLDPSFDVETLTGPPIVKLVARAAQRYGMIVRDRGGAVALYGEDPTPTGSPAWDVAFGGLKNYQVLRTFPWSRLQVPTMVPVP